MIEILGLNLTHTFRSIVELQCLKRQTWRKTPALGKLQSKLSGYIEHNIITVNIFYCMICPTRSSQLATRNSQLAARSSQLATRSSQLAARNFTARKLPVPYIKLLLSHCLAMSLVCSVYLLYQIKLLLNWRDIYSVHQFEVFKISKPSTKSEVLNQLTFYALLCIREHFYNAYLFNLLTFHTGRYI